ncbi:hypothetical protein TNCV_3345901 [Trichonephila clavipes]|nr:hypothetical protein TNCV_3345901 [Trichonephila clavipes]
MHCHIGLLMFSKYWKVKTSFKWIDQHSPLIQIPWNMCGMPWERRLEAGLHCPKKPQLIRMLIEEWALLPQELLENLGLSMLRRCKATIAGDYESDLVNRVHSLELEKDEMQQIDMQLPVCPEPPYTGYICPESM